MNIIIIGIIIAIAFLLQGLLGWFQVKNFAKNYDALRKKGRVLIGKNPKRIRAGSLMLLGIDENDRIFDARVMKGITVFSHFKRFNKIEGMYVAEAAANHQLLFSLDKTERECLLNAYRNLVNFKTHSLSFEDFDTSIHPLAMPLIATAKNKFSKLFSTIKNPFKSNNDLL